MIPRVNGVVLLAHLPDWGQAPKTERRWQSAVASALSGVEERASMRQDPTRILSWRITPFDAAERGSLDDQLRVALLEGAAATPWWGRGLAVTAASASTVTLADSVPAAWVPEVGSHIAFLGPWATPGGAAWEVAEVESVAGRTLTLAESLAGTWSGACWEILSGTLSIRGGEAMTDHTGPVDLRIEGVRGVVAPYGYVTPPATDCAADAYAVPTNDALVPVVERVMVIPANMLSLVYQLSVSSEASGVDQAVALWEWAEYVPDIEDAVWQTDALLVAQESSDPTLWHCRMKFRTTYYLRATVNTFGASLTSEPILIPALTPEAMMRTVQERLTDVGLTAVTWPYSLPSYPTDGACDALVIEHGEATAMATVLEAIRQALRTSGFLRHYQATAGSLSAGYKATPRTRAFDVAWGLTPGSGFVVPAYDPVMSETLLGTAITTANWSAWWDDIGRVILQLYKRLDLGERSDGWQVNGFASQLTGDMKPEILASGGLGETAQDVFDGAGPGASSDPFGIRSTVTPTSVDTYVWGQVYNSPGEVRISWTYGTWGASVEGVTGTKACYRAAYYSGYGLTQIGVVGQDGVTPYHALAGLTDVFYSGAAYPINIPAGEIYATPSSHTQFALIQTIPYESDGEVIEDVLIGSGLATGDIDFFWLDVFNTTSRPLRDLGVEMVCYVSWYRSPWPEDAHWDHYLHQPIPE